MDERTHIPFAKLLSCLIQAEPLSDDEQEHRKKCSVCQTAAVTQHGSFLQLTWVYSREVNTGCRRDGIDLESRLKSSLAERLRIAVVSLLKRVSIHKHPFIYGGMSLLFMCITVANPATVASGESPTSLGGVSPHAAVVRSDLCSFNPPVALKFWFAETCAAHNDESLSDYRRVTAFPTLNKE